MCALTDDMVTMRPARCASIAGARALHQLNVVHLDVDSLPGGEDRGGYFGPPVEPGSPAQAGR